MADVQIIVRINTCMWRWWGQKAVMQREKKHKESNEEKKPLKTYENMIVSPDEYSLFLQIGYEVVIVIYKL